MNIVEFFSIGTEVQRRIEETIDAYGNSYGADVAGEVAKEYGILADRARKSRDFANKFTRREANQLQSLGLSVSHCVAVLKLPQHAERVRLLEAAAEGGWSVRKLSAQVNAHTEVRGYGGRPTSRKTLPEVADELRLLCARMNKCLDEYEHHAYWGMNASEQRKVRALRRKVEWLESRMNSLR